MSRVKYTKELLESVCKECISRAEVIRKLGLREAGGTHAHISKKITEYGIDVSHFLGQRANSGTRHCGGNKKQHWSEVLVKREQGKRQHAFRLRRAMIEAGRPYVCSQCGLGDKWNGKTIMLQVEHKSRDWLDDRSDNLEFVCPNCHSQTEGWCGSKGLSSVCSAKYKSNMMTAVCKCGKQMRSDSKVCRQCHDKRMRQQRKSTRCECGRPMQRYSRICRICHNKNVKEDGGCRKVERPSLQQLLQEVKELGYCSTGRKYGVSDNAIRKWIKAYKK